MRHALPDYSAARDCGPTVALRRTGTGQLFIAAGPIWSIFIRLRSPKASYSGLGSWFAVGLVEDRNLGGRVAGEETRLPVALPFGHLPLNGGERVR